MTFLFSTTKQFGVLSAIRLMLETNVSMLIIGKIFAENQMYLIINLSSVQCGKTEKIQKTIKMAARSSIDVQCVTDGRSQNFIQISTKRKNVDLKLMEFAKSSTAHTIIMRVKKDYFLQTKTLNFGLEIEREQHATLRNISKVTTKNSSKTNNEQT